MTMATSMWRPLLRVLSRALDIIVFPAMLVSLALAFFYAPPDAVMHDVYRIFFFHVPATAGAGLGIAVTFVCSLLYLRTRDPRYDIVAAAAAECAVVFATLGIVMGMIWARPVWGVYWLPGDIHLMTTAIVYLVYVAYLMLRGAVADEERRARLCAVIGIVGVIGVPIVFFSIRVIQVGNHPVLLSLDPRMALTFVVCMNSMLLFFTFILLRRVRLGFARAAAEQLRADVLTRAERRVHGIQPRRVAGAPVAMTK